jgi:histidine ammonia-lyase
MITIVDQRLAIDDVIRVTRHNEKIRLSKTIKQRVLRSREFLESIIHKGKTVYGVNTGFGPLNNVVIPKHLLDVLQVNLVRSHSASVGENSDRETVRGMMFLLAYSLAQGYSGIRFDTLKTLVEMLNRGVHPRVPKKGSVGASGDLSPQAHLAAVLIGEGEAEFRGKMLPGFEAMKQAGIEPIQLSAKEGLALINGLYQTCSIACHMLYDAERLIKQAEIVSGLSIEALRGHPDAFDERLMMIKPHKGQISTARFIMSLLRGSCRVRFGSTTANTMNHISSGVRMDAYTLRCIPQVYGAVRDAIEFAKRVLTVEINSVSDNPVVLAEDTYIEGGNFIGTNVAMMMDHVGVALTVMGNFSERRTARLIDRNLNKTLPNFLIVKNGEEGLSSGLMIVQYVAAALASENKVLAHPASADSIPTGGNFEDFVSMAPAAANKARTIMRNTTYIIAIEAISAVQALSLENGGKDLGDGTKLAYQLIRNVLPSIDSDRQLSQDIEAVTEMLMKGSLLDHVLTNLL